MTICVDAKLDYPAACNACETVLLHQVQRFSDGHLSNVRLSLLTFCSSTLQTSLTNGMADAVLRALRSSGATVLGGPRAIAEGLVSAEHGVNGFSIEYGNKTCCVEVVESLEAAIDHINRYILFQ